MIYLFFTSLEVSNLEELLLALSILANMHNCQYS